MLPCRAVAPRCWGQGLLSSQGSHSRLIGALIFFITLIFQVLRDDRDLPYSSSQLGSSLASGSAPNQMFN